MPRSVTLKIAHAAEKWLRRAIPQSRASDAVLGHVCRSLGMRIGGNAAVEIRRAAKAIGGSIEFVRLLNLLHVYGDQTTWPEPRGLFFMQNLRKEVSSTINSAGRTLVPEVIEMGLGKRMWYLKEENLIMSIAGLNHRTGELLDESGCVIRSVWGAIHNGRKSYSNIKASLGIIENLTNKTRRRDIGQAGVFSSSINDYITNYGYRLDRVHKSDGVGLQANKYAFKTIFAKNPNCIMLVRLPKEENSNHAFEIRNGLPVGCSPEDFYSAKEVDSVEAVSVPIWGGRWT